MSGLKQNEVVDLIHDYERELRKAQNYDDTSGFMTTGNGLYAGNLQRQSIEDYAVLSAKTSPADNKMLGSSPLQKVFASKHEVVRQKSYGYSAYTNHHVAEGGGSDPTDGEYDKKEYTLKTVQILKIMSMQMGAANTIINAHNQLVRDGIDTLNSDIEQNFFCGRNDLNPNAPDGFEAQMLKDAVGKTHFYDMSGKSLQAYGYEALSEAARMIKEDSGAMASRILLPYQLINSLQSFVTDKIWLNSSLQSANNSALVAQMTANGITLPLASNLRINGQDAGVSKFFRVKDKVVATPTNITSGEKNPALAPTFTLTAATAKVGQRGFKADEAGTYFYSVHAVNDYGISPEATRASIAVLEGQAVEIKVTPNTLRSGSYFIVTRGAVNGLATGDLYELDSFGFAGVASNIASETTVYDDNSSLPATGKIYVLGNDLSGKTPAAILYYLFHGLEVPVAAYNAAQSRTLVLSHYHWGINSENMHAVIKNVSTGLVAEEFYKVPSAERIATPDVTDDSTASSKASK